MRAGVAEHALVTLNEITLGLTVGITLGIITALQFELSPAAKFFLKPVLIFSQAIPVFALAPVLTLWLGYGMISKVTMQIQISHTFHEWILVNVAHPIVKCTSFRQKGLDG